VAIEFEILDYGYFIWESLPKHGVRMTLSKNRLKGERFEKYEIKGDLDKMFDMLGMKYSWWSDIISPFKIKRKITKAVNCVEAINEILGTDYTFPYEFFFSLNKEKIQHGKSATA
jgi:hypothetical protein